MSDVIAFGEAWTKVLAAADVNAGAAMNTRLPAEALRPIGRIGRRERAAQLEARMLKFSAIFNSACLLRHAWHGAEDRRLACARELADAVLQALQAPGADVEAALYALADALYCSPLGVPWEP